MTKKKVSNGLDRVLLASIAGAWVDAGDSDDLEKAARLAVRLVLGDSQEILCVNDLRSAAAKTLALTIKYLDNGGEL